MVSKIYKRSGPLLGQASSRALPLSLSNLLEHLHGSVLTRCNIGGLGAPMCLCPRTRMIERRDCNALSPQRHLEDPLCDDDWICGSHSELSELDLHSCRCSAHSTWVRRGDLVIQSDRLSICTRKHPGSLPGRSKRGFRRRKLPPARQMRMTQLQNDIYRSRKGRIMLLLREVGSSIAEP